jgi:predicted metalloprotease
MRWESGRRSSNVEDRRGVSGARRGGVVGGGALLIVVLYVLLTGRDPQEVVQVLENTAQPPASTSPIERPAEEDRLADFVSVVLADTEDTWKPLFREMGRDYEEPTLVLFTDAVDSACGYTTSATGPFYCPGDRKLYIDLGFYGDLRDRFGAPGDFAQAYVIAHEVGHHVQNLLGTSGQVDRMQRQVGQTKANELSVRLELQADCYAGIWGHYANSQRRLLDEGDIEEGLNAAAAIGDDRLQKMSGRRINPDAFTHGSSTQRVEWFRTGLETGDLRRCDTFR